MKTVFIKSRETESVLNSLLTTSNFVEVKSEEDLKEEGFFFIDKDVFEDNNFLDLLKSVKKQKIFISISEEDFARLEIDYNRVYYKKKKN